jgi:hypothetical protein
MSKYKMDSWTIVNQIKNGRITYKVGDKVICFRRKTNGHPRRIKDYVEYTIKSITNDDFHVATHSLDGIGWNNEIKIHKTYMISKNELREIKINQILK